MAPEGDEWGHDLDVEIPDDARELDRDLHAWRREERWRRWRAAGSRMLFTRRWQRFGLSGPLIVVLLVGVALVGGLVALITPRTTNEPPKPAAIALASTTVAPGAVGGLLPDVMVDTTSGSRDVRDLRPAVVALPVQDCNCAVELSMLVLQAREYRLTVYIAGPPERRAQLSGLAGTGGHGLTPVIEDKSGALTATFRPTGLTAVLVAADGTVTDVVRDLQTGTRLEAKLGVLPAASSSPVR